MTDDKKRYVKNNLENQVNQETLEWVQQRYLPFLKRQGLADSTEANRLQALKKLLVIEELEPQNWKQQETDIKEIGEKVAGNIQANQYQEQGNTGMSLRRKRLVWTCFKNMVKLQGIDTDKLPDFKPRETGKVNHRAKNTKPEELPNPRQLRKFLSHIEQYSKPSNKLRNQSLVLLMWDKGPRIGEALNIQLKHCTINNDSLEIFIQGNKKHTEDRTVQIYQGRKTLKEFIETHPGSEDDYLFSDTDHNNLGKPVYSQKFAKKHKQIAAQENIQFKIRGEPTHIFRKAMTTAHIVNEWATWEEVCKLQGKPGDGTKPTYLKMALNDVNKSVGQKIGAVDDSDNPDMHMIGDPLLPEKCSGCGRINKCFRKKCEYCSGDLKTIQRTAFQDSREEDETMETLQQLKSKINNKIDDLE